MKKNSLLLFIICEILSLLLLNAKLFGQLTAPAIEWERCFGGSNIDQGNSISVTNDGGYIFSGCTSSVDGDILMADGVSCDYWYAKIDAAQNIIFKWNPGGVAYDIARSAFQTSDGGYFIGGSADSYNGDVTCSKANFFQADFWVLKLDGSGNVQWELCYGGTQPDYYGSGAEVAGSGYVFCGSTSSNNDDVSGNHGSSDFWLAKTDYAGAIQWAKCYGGTDYENAYDVKVCADGGYIIVGFTESQDGDITGYHGGLDGWAVKTDSGGNVQWAKCFGGAGLEEFYKVIQLSNGNFVMAGWTDSNDGDISFLHGSTFQEDAWLVTTDVNGNLLWSRTYGGDSVEEFTSLLQDARGNIDAVGYSLSNNGDLPGNFGSFDYWLAGIDTNGTLLWDGIYGGSADDVCADVAATSDGGLIVNGSTNSEDGEVTGFHDFYGFFYIDFWVVKFSSVVGINDPVKPALMVYPTLAHDLIQLTGLCFQEKGMQLKVISADGKQMLSKKIKQSSELVINASSFPQGIYFIEATCSQTKLVAKFMKY